MCSILDQLIFIRRAQLSENKTDRRHSLARREAPSPTLKVAPLPRIKLEMSLKML